MRWRSNKICDGDRVEILSPTALGLSFTARNIAGADGCPLCAASQPSVEYAMDCGVPTSPGNLLRIRTDERTV